MIAKNVKCFCKDFTKIENYASAIADEKELWICHHKLEQVFTVKELIRAGWYYDRKPQELIFIRKSEHNGNRDIHISYKAYDKKQIGKEAWNKGKKTGYAPWKGKKRGERSIDEKSKISATVSKTVSEKVDFYHKYKANGGKLTWNKWQKEVWVKHF